MKRFELFIAMATLTTVAAYGQNAGGTSGAATPAPSAPLAPSAANQAPASSTTIQGQSTTPLINRQQTLAGAGTNGLAVATNAFGFNSNRFGMNTNRFQTNFLANGGTNRGGLSPTANPGMQNRAYSSNNPAAGPYAATNRLGPASSYGTNAANGTDSNTTATTAAMTPGDRTVMFSVRQAVQTAFAAGVQPSVNYIVNGGVVTLVGLVPTIEEKLAVQTVAGSVPGVNRVVNNIQVNNAAGLAASNAVPASSFATGSVTAVNQPRATATNGVFPVATNLTPTSSNGSSRIYSPTRTGLPPGLENRQTLPLGLENREQLPPGLSTNSTGRTP